jgi:hypothetical protein
VAEPGGAGCDGGPAGVAGVDAGGGAEAGVRGKVASWQVMDDAFVTAPLLPQ